MLRHAAALTLSMALVGCGWFGIGTPPKDQTAAKAEDTKAGDAKAGDAKADGTKTGAEQANSSNDGKKDTPKQLSQEEIAKQMAPPDGLMDMREFIGTDTSDPKPAIFAKVNKGMTKNELNGVFVGVARYSVQYITLTSGNGGKTWYRVKGNQPHLDILNVEYDDDMKLDTVGYLIDPKKTSAELWAYMKKAAGLKWGKPDLGDLNEDSKYARWKPDGVSAIELSGGETLSLSLKL